MTYGINRHNNRPEWIVIHHSETAGPADATLAADAFDRYHRKANGWDCIGYHGVIGVDGSSEAGRYETSSGAHALGFNTRSLGLCLVGRLDWEPPEKAQMATALEWIRGWMQTYSIPPERVIGHRETYLIRRGYDLGQIDAMEWVQMECAGAEKTCPGLSFGMARLRSQLSQGPQEEAMLEQEAESMECEAPPSDVQETRLSRLIDELRARLERMREERAK